MEALELFWKVLHSLVGSISLPRTAAAANEACTCQKKTNPRTDLRIVAFTVPKIWSRWFAFPTYLHPALIVGFHGWPEPSDKAPHETLISSQVTARSPPSGLRRLPSSPALCVTRAPSQNRKLAPCLSFAVGPLWLALDFALGLWCARLARNKMRGLSVPTGLERRPQPFT